MTDFTEVTTNAETGEVTVRPFTSEEIAAILAKQPSREEQEAARRAAYTVEADPIFFMAQRGEATMAEWETKVAEIKARFPYP
jgi:hypothetical protein